MVKKKSKNRLGRHGLPVKSAKIIVAVTPQEKRQIQAAARKRGRTVSQHLLQQHMRQAYGWEKFYSAMGGMVQGTESLQDRLHNAHVFSLIHVRDENLPEEFHSKFKELMVQCEDAKKLSDDEAISVASDLFEMYVQLEQLRARW